MSEGHLPTEALWIEARAWLTSVWLEPKRRFPQICEPINKICVISSFRKGAASSAAKFAEERLGYG
jgi:hypothetical protein